tara:strand:- start:1583 stop:1768 length:186 start_codon:yes stop_codon:yes gene_type:complete
LLTSSNQVKAKALMPNLPNYATRGGILVSYPVPPWQGIFILRTCIGISRPLQDKKTTKPFI